LRERQKEKVNQEGLEEELERENLDWSFGAKVKLWF